MEIRNWKLVAALSLFSIFYFPISTSAQITTVTGQVLDVNGIPYAGAQLKAQLVTTAGSPVTGQPTITNNSAASCKQAGFGSAPCQIPFQGTFGPTSLDSAGNLPAGGIQLQDNTQVTPASTQWLFTVNETGNPLPLGTGPQTCSAQITISGASQSVSSSFAACPSLINLARGVNFEVGGTPISNQTVVNFQATGSPPGLTWAVTNPSAGNVDYSLTPTGGLAQNEVMATPDGSSGAYSLRALVGNDLPASTSNCSGNSFAQGFNAGFTPICNTPSSLTGVLLFSGTTLGSDVAVSATTPTTVMTRTVTMPASGCPCRAFFSYSLYVNTGSSGVGYSTWINDGTNNMAGVNQGQSNASSGALASMSYGGFSTVTYANNANVTFTLTTEGDHTYTVKAASVAAGSAPNSSFEVAIFTSN